MIHGFLFYSNLQLMIFEIKLCVSCLYKTYLYILAEVKSIKYLMIKYRTSPGGRLRISNKLVFQGSMVQDRLE